ncbi:dTDP-4-dehydrorhamnose 3,5-epimerase [Massilia sp. Mn16-1_5]|uniref:dTDP-4-dehydrorhamnose 3,5-epimerase n=1 Tax=Massilia sp. Mn16-1_5 TaxID=2079199 RepID=UPI00109E98BE|nr:dTDP-4-dehydrorhamnose 3,5-epimerase [Massilia sp. Mn16-1_5]THC43808.1 dTDP-4-dehydrorhamnose 3,5-epimerase [Massilia sp. Mn16-1_5]
MFETQDTGLPGCLLLQPRVLEDARGRFVKTFHEGAFRALGLEAGFVEQYYSHSHRGVVRGMHFQKPPAQHAKLVYCVHGEVFDVVLDLRRGSPTYGQTRSFTLSASQGNALYIAAGMAHGFCATSELATLVYNVTSVYAPEQDEGVRWDSIGVQWPAANPLVSPRDAAFAALADFDSPFTYD